MGSLMTTSAASVPITCEYCTQYSLLEWQARVSAPGGFSSGTNISVFLFQPPEALVTWILFLDALFAPWGRSQLSTWALCEGCAIWAGERVDGTVVFGQKKEWMELLNSTQWEDLTGLLPLRIMLSNDRETLVHQAIKCLLYYIYWLWVWFAFCGTWVSQGSGVLTPASPFQTTRDWC